MNKARHNLLNYLIIFGLMLLPVQYGQAMDIDSMMPKQVSSPCLDNNAVTNTSAMQDGKSCHHADHSTDQLTAQLTDTQTVCDTEQNCADHNQCGKYQIDIPVIRASIRNTGQSLPLSFLSSFSEFVTFPDLRPPKV